MQEKIWVSIEGPIGAGKSTLTKKIMPYLEEHYGTGKVAFIPEPVNMWTAYMKKFTTDPRRFSFLFQVYAFHTRQEIFNEVFAAHPTATLFISERSPLTDRFVFWEANRELHELDSLEADTYPHLWNTWMKLYPLMLKKMIYLDLDTDVCAKRIRERARDTEVDFVSNNYQELLKEKHWKLFEKNIVPHSVLSSDQNYRDDPEIAREYARRVIEMLNNE